MGVKLNTASGGSVSIEPTNTASNYTLTVPAQTGTVIASDSSGNVNIDSNTLYVDATNDRVGIGTSSPAQKLDVNGSIQGGKLLLSSDPSYVETSAGSLVLRGLAGNLDLHADPNGTHAGSTLKMYVDGTERMRIDSSGNLLVGTTSTGVENGNYFKMEVSNRYMRFGHSGTGNGTDFVKFDYNGTQTGGINQNSTTSVAYVTTSDYRLKENIAPMTGALEKVAQLKPCTYTWKSNGEQAEGFIAHELAEVCPSAVTGEKDWVDADGNPVYQGIDTSFLVATLTAAIQELNAKVDAQAAEIALLKGQA